MQQKNNSFCKAFNKHPIKSASIAQVHEAVLKDSGERVAVKVQHNWLKQYSPGDIKIVYWFVQIGERLFPEFQFKWFADEIEVNMKKELNFLEEVANSERCQQLLKSHTLIKIPKNHLSLCNEKVIVMEFVEGVPIMDVQTLRDEKFNLPEVARVISKAFC